MPVRLLLTPVLLVLVSMPCSARLDAQLLQPADDGPLNEVRATGAVQVLAEVFMRKPGSRDDGSRWLEVRGEIRSGASGPVVVEVGQCPVILVAYADRERTQPVWVGRSGAGCPDPDARIRREVTATRGHPLRQSFAGTRDGVAARGPHRGASLPTGRLHFSMIARVNGRRQSWPAGSLFVSDGP